MKEIIIPAQPTKIEHKSSFNQEAEMGVLGSILFDYEKVLGFCVQKHVTAKSFYFSPHRIIYAAMLKMFSASCPIDTMTLVNQLQGQGELEKVGGLLYLNKLLDSTPAATHAEYYIDLVLDQAGKRQLEKLALLIADSSNNGKNNLETINEIQANLDAIRPIDTSFTVRSLTDYADAEIDQAKTLLGNRFLCREGGMLFVGPSGVGKSSASVQQDILWALGQPAFDIQPARPLRVATIQAENDNGDLTEMARGIMGGLDLTAEQREIVKQNTFYVAEKAKTAKEFTNFVEAVLRVTKPDMLRLDPLQSYIGGDTSDPEVVSNFVHVGLNPLLQKYQCACIVNHHTPKTNTRDTSKWKSSDWQYAGAGSAVLTNWARAIIIVDPCKDNQRLFRFVAAKRGWRVDWRDENDMPTIFKHFKHAQENGTIFWQPATDEEVEASIKAPKTKFDLVDLVPADESISKDDLIAKAKSEGIGMNRARKFINELLDEKSLFVWKIPRPGTNPRIDLARVQQPEPVLAV
ncbi:MAG: DnaB-like helicase N-terminal domain-containing protein [Smithellaceae bacterium]|jgi:hypothetical protein